MGRRAFGGPDRDARRRVALLWAGTTLSLTPILGIVIYALATDQDFAFARENGILVSISTSAIPSTAPQQEKLTSRN